MATPQISMGLQPDGVFGVRVASPGYDVLSNPIDNEQLIFNSDWASVIPIYQSGTLAVGAGATNNVSFTSLGGVPLIIVAAPNGSDWDFMRDKNWAFWFTTTDLYISNATAGSITFKYWVTRLIIS